MKRYLLWKERRQTSLPTLRVCAECCPGRKARTVDGPKRLLQNLQHQLSVTIGLGYEGVHVFLWCVGARVSARPRQLMKSGSGPGAR